MNFPEIIKISADIKLELLSNSHKVKYFNSIHESTENDKYRKKLQERMPNLEQVEVMLDDAINSKLKETGSPDYFIIYEGQIAGMFEFHPIDKGDYIEIGYWLFSKFRRRGILSRTIPEMIKFTQEYFSKPKILATTPVDNIPSQALLNKMKFAKTGRILEFTDSKTGHISQEFEYIYHLPTV